MNGIDYAIKDLYEKLLKADEKDKDLINAQINQFLVLKSEKRGCEYVREDNSNIVTETWRDKSNRLLDFSYQDNSKEHLELERRLHFESYQFEAEKLVKCIASNDVLENYLEEEGR